MFRTINPANEEVLEEYEIWSKERTYQALQKADQCFSKWKTRDFSERKHLFAQLALVLKEQRDEFARIMTQEMGKPFKEARAEVDKCILACDYFSNLSGEWLSDLSMLQDDPKVDVVSRPLGVILGIMPWNFPLWQVIRFALPTLAIGNVVVVKHAPNTWGTSLKLAKAFAKAGFPEASYTHLSIDVDQVPLIVADPLLRGVSLTGSTRAGRAVASLAGQWIKPCVLELGGSDPYIVLDDANLDLAAEKCVVARMQNGGQSCIAAKRWIVAENVFEEFLERVKILIESYPCSDPEEEDSRLGPMARKDLLEHLKDQVNAATSRGAVVAYQGNNNLKRGFYYPATLLTGLEKAPLPQDEEIFGPVACLYKAKSNEDALAIAHQSTYGLGAAIFSGDEKRAIAWARNHIEAGMVAVNGMVRSDPRWPFGGIRDSGFGRELTWLGAKEFSNQKVVIVD